MFINKKTLAKLLNISPSTVYRWSIIGNIPKPIAIGPNKTMWLKEEIDEWIIELKRNPRGYGKPKIVISNEK